MFWTVGFAGQKERTLKNPLFVFNNGLNKQDLPFIPYKEQASMLKKYGFDGIEHREIQGILELKDALEKQGLKIYADYLKIDIDQKEPYLPEWKHGNFQIKRYEDHSLGTHSFRKIQAFR